IATYKRHEETDLDQSRPRTRCPKKYSTKTQADDHSRDKTQSSILFNELIQYFNEISRKTISRSYHRFLLAKFDSTVTPRRESLI
ncbi:MAG: hypothetical protein MHMPM18_004727, partial [Marteilia pararefringens]